MANKQYSMLLRYANQLANSQRKRRLFFLCSALMTVTIMGYHFGTFDQVAHIPFMKKYVDPNLYPQDAFVEIRHQMYSFFWILLQPFYRLRLLEPAMFVAHVIATYWTFSATWTLCIELFASPVAALIASLAFIFPHVGFAGFPIFEFSLLNRTFVFPFLLWVIWLYLRGNLMRALALLGLVYNLHVISAQFVLLMIGFDYIIAIRRIRWLSLLGGCVLFLACASPVLIWKLSGSPLELQPQWHWYSVISKGALYNVFYLIAPIPYVLLATASGIGAICLYLVGRSASPPSKYDSHIRNFMIAIGLVLAVEFVTSLWYPSTIVVQSQIIRVGVFALFFGYIFFAWHLATISPSSRRWSFDFTILFTAFVASTIPLIPLMVWLGQRIRANVFWWRIASLLLAGTGFVGFAVLAASLGLWYPGIHIYPRATTWYDAQTWARENSSIDALFITPPHIWSFYTPEWRVFSERSPVVSLSELLVAAFVPEYIQVWEPRFEQLAPGALSKFGGDIFENQKLTKAAFAGLTSADFLRIACSYGADYLVIEKPTSYKFPVVYENEDYVIFSFPALPAGMSC